MYLRKGKKIMSTPRIILVTVAVVVGVLVSDSYGQRGGTKPPEPNVVKPGTRPVEPNVVKPGTWRGVGLTLKIEASGPRGLASGSLPVESCPLALRFEFQQDVASGTGGGIPTTLDKSVSPLGNEENPLLQLSYSIYNSTGLDEVSPYFSDIVDLYGYTGPSSLEITPGIYVPPDSRQIVVHAKLLYQRINLEGRVESVSEGHARIDVQQLLADQRYHRYRDGYLRRHLLLMGRELSELWLKEYEPGKDRKEMLYHSRCFKAPGANQTRLYVPWLYPCGSPGCPGCGRTIAPGAPTIYGGVENPLLRGGLAMSVFSLEYLGGRDVSSLRHALLLFSYVQKSEWMNANGSPTGFFLRSRWPGYDSAEKGYGTGEYFYASTDEIIGMTLGLYYLHEALTLAINTTSDPSLREWARGHHDSVTSLVERLATQSIPPPEVEACNVNRSKRIV
jgi:hypothetical protein